MTREERAQLWLADYFDQYGKHGGADELRDGRMITMTSITAVNAMLSFADDEAAAMRERAAKVAQAEADDIRAHGQDRDQWQQGRMMMADTIAAAIRALSARGEG